MYGHDDDDLMWDGLACPPLEDYAFNFDTNFTPDDGVLDDLEIDEEDDEDIVTEYFKQDKELDNMVAACMANPLSPLSGDLLDLLPAELDKIFPVSEKTRRKPTIAPRPCGKGKDIKILAQVLQVEMHSKTFYGYHAVDFKNREAGHDLKFKGGVTMLDHTNGLGVGNKRKLDVVDRMKNDNYESKFEASRHKLHEDYQRSEEAKRQKKIQIIDFHIPVTKQPKCNPKSKGKPSLRAKLMAMETRKTYKKFPSFSSCVH